jgi:hypothetical protein
MSELDRQTNEADKQRVIAQQKRGGVLRCFIDDQASPVL